MIDKELLDILACPACKGDVVLAQESIVCTRCKRRYPVVDGIPVMLIEEARLDEPGAAAADPKRPKGAV